MSGFDDFEEDRIRMEAIRLEENRQQETEAETRRQREHELLMSRTPGTMPAGRTVRPPRPGFFSRPVLRAGSAILINRGVFVALPLALILLLALRNGQQLLPLWIREVVAGLVLLPALPALRHLISRVVIPLVLVAVAITVAGLALNWWHLTLFGHYL